jgi:hypothetical protein
LQRDIDRPLARHHVIFRVGNLATPSALEHKSNAISTSKTLIAFLASDTLCAGITL